MCRGRGEREERERDSTNAVPPHLRRDVSSGIQAVWPPRVAVLVQFGRARSEGSERTLRELSPGSRYSGNPTDVRPRDASLVVSQALARTLLLLVLLVPYFRTACSICLRLTKLVASTARARYTGTRARYISAS